MKNSNYPTTSQLRKLFVTSGPAKWNKAKSAQPAFSVRERNGEFWITIKSRVMGKQRIADKMIGQSILVDLDTTYVVTGAKVLDNNKDVIVVEVKER